MKLIFIIWMALLDIVFKGWYDKMKLKKMLKKFIINDIDFIKKQNSNKKYLILEKITFNNLIDNVLNDIFENMQESLFLNKKYLDISYIIFNDKIIDLDFIYSVFVDYLNDYKSEYEKIKK